MLRYTLLVVLLICICPATQAQSTNSTGVYAVDLGQVYGAANAIKELRDLCATNFPEYARENASAYENWRTKHLPLLQKINNDMSLLLWHKAGGNEEKDLKELDNLHRKMKAIKQGMKDHFISEGHGKFKTICKLYPSLLQMKRTNLESYYKEQIQTIRAREKQLTTHSSGHP